MIHERKIPPYSYGYAKTTYDKLIQYEITSTIKELRNEEVLIIRLDGKGLTERFKDEKELFLPEFHLAMRRVLENIKKYCPFIEFAYSYKDEVSFLLNKEYIATNKKYKNRLEKILPIISGYVSAMFSQYISRKFKEFQTEAFAFDARIIILPKDMLKDYFHARQSFAMGAFIDRVCSFYKLPVEKRNLSEVIKALKEIGKDWDKFPQYVCSGCVGISRGDKLEVTTASDFSQK